MSKISGVQYTGNPPGTIMPCANGTALARTLLCNGDTVPNGVGTVQGVTANFAGLYAALGSTYGAAGQLPDTRGIFLRGAGSQSILGISYTATLGNKQDDRMQGHFHGTLAGGNPNTFGSSYNSGQTNAYSSLWQTAGGSQTVWGVGSPSSDGGNGTPRTASETRPANVGVNYCIAY